MNNQAKNEIPSSITNDEIEFSRLGQMEDIDIKLTKDGSMEIERVFWDEENEEWDGKEITAEEVEDELENVRFLAVAESPMTFRQIRANFTHKLKI